MALVTSERARPDGDGQPLTEIVGAEIGLAGKGTAIRGLTQPE